MKIARSLYLLGEIISADKGDYTVCKRFHLVCPLCRSAVFWRAGYTKKINEKLISVAPAFCHYSDPENDCENKIKQPDSQKLIEAIKVVSKGQRLKIYNERLWQLFLEDNRINMGSKNTRKKILKKLNTKDPRTLTKEVKNIWKSDFTFWQKQITKQIRIFIDRNNREELILKQSHPQAQQETFIEQKDYFKHNCEIDLHQSVLREIAEFLTTNSSIHFWRNMSIYALTRTYQDLQEYQHFNNNLSLDLKSEFISAKKALFNPQEHPYLICHYSVAMLVGTHWLEILKSASKIANPVGVN